MSSSRQRIQIRTSSALIEEINAASVKARIDRNAWICKTLAKWVDNGLPVSMATESALTALGGTRDNLTIIAPVELVDRIDQRAEARGVRRSIWIGLALATLLE